MTPREILEDGYYSKTRTPAERSELRKLFYFFRGDSDSLMKDLMEATFRGFESRRWSPSLVGMPQPGGPLKGKNNAKSDRRNSRGMAD